VAYKATFLRETNIVGMARKDTKWFSIQAWEQFS